MDLDSLRFEVLGGNPTDRQVSDINELLKQLTSNPKLVERAALKKITDQSGVFVIVVKNDEERFIAMATLDVREFLLKISAMVEDVVVDSKYRGIKLRKKMMEYIIKMAREKGCSFVSLTSHPRRKESNHMYKGLGFELIGKINESNYYRLMLGLPYKEMLIKIIKMADKAYIKNSDMAEFEKGLINEVNFIVPCDKNEMKKLESYIREHIKELYEFALSLSKNNLW